MVFFLPRTVAGKPTWGWWLCSEWIQTLKMDTWRTLNEDTATQRSWFRGLQTAHSTKLTIEVFVYLCHTWAQITVKSVTIKLCMGFIIRRLHGHLRYFLCFLVLRDIDVRQGKVHGRVWWVNQPDFGHFFDFGSEFLICICLYVALVQFLFWFVCSTTDGRLGHWDRERIFLSWVLWWILNERWLSDGFCALTHYKFRM